MKLCFATHNQHKLEELRHMLEGQFEVVGLDELGCHEEIPEEQDTLDGNAFQKAEYVWEHYGVSCFADDTGLEVTALDGAPGVYSARYAGPEKDSGANMQKLLKDLKGKTDRSAQFRTVVALILNGERHQFEGIVKGSIREESSGTKGFGYDPIFQPDNYSITFAEMPLAEKNKISHRGRAMQQLFQFLTQKQPD